MIENMVREEKENAGWSDDVLYVRATGFSPPPSQGFEIETKVLATSPRFLPGDMGLFLIGPLSIIMGQMEHLSSVFRL